MKKSIKVADPPDKLSPLPEYLESYRNKIANFGMFFQKFGQYHLKSSALNTQHSWNNQKKGKERQDYEWSLLQNQIDHYSTHCKTALQILETRHRLQHEALMAIHALGPDTIEWPAVSITRFLTGIGEASPTEVGMLFDRNSGIPFIPASSIKGCVRQAYCVNFAKSCNISDDEIIDEKNVPGFVEIFGSLDVNQASRGGFSFFDAYSLKIPELTLDIMNPHFGKYYKSEGPPIEIEEPVPIKFLAIEKGVTFIIRGFFLNKKAQKFRKNLIEAIQTALGEIGIGAKTAVGYGRFDTGGINQAKNENKISSSKTVADDKPKNQVWEKVFLTYSPGNALITAISENKKATCKGLDKVPEAIAQILKNKKRARVVAVKVEPIGNGFRIIEVNAN